MAAAIEDDSSNKVSGLKRTRLCDDIELSLALKYELSSLVQLSDGVVFVGLVLCIMADCCANGKFDRLLLPKRGLEFEYLRKLERNFVPLPISNAKLSGRSTMHD